MAGKKVGDLIKAARTEAGMTQEQLARKVKNTSAADIGKAERGEKELTQAALKEIARATGVTQKSLLDAAKGTSSSGSLSSARKTAAPAKKTAPVKKTAASQKSTSAAGKTTAAKKTATAAKKPAAAAKKPAATARRTASGTGVKLTAAEKRVLDLYRAASSETRKAAEMLLRGVRPDDGNPLSELIGGAIEWLTGR